MSKPLLAVGAKGPSVVELQELINKWSKHEYGKFAEIIKTDGAFGSITKRKVKDFQVSCFLYKDGIVGSKTWSALLGNEMYNSFDLPIPFVSAPDEYTCWAGATAMLLRKSGHIPLKPRPSGIAFEILPGDRTGGVENSHANMQKFANHHHIQMFKAEQLSCIQLCNLVDQFGRLMLNIKGINSKLQKTSPDDSHLLILAGVRGTGQRGGTTITLYNPSAVGWGGRVSSASYNYFKNKYPRLTYQVFYSYSNRSVPVYNPNVIS